MRIRRPAVALGLLGVLTLAGCEASVSTDEDGEGVEADVDVDEDGDGQPEGGDG